MDIKVNNTSFETRPLHTKDITVISNITSIVVTGDKISKLPSSTTEESGVIHLNFEVKEKKHQGCVLADAEEICLILDRADALELGLLLLEMEVNEQTPEELGKIKARLTPLLGLSGDR
jgi:hypothetical protein